MATRTCSECGGSLAHLGIQAKTCSNKCRLSRSRRMRKQSISATAPHLQAIGNAVYNDAPDLIRDVVREELRPIVREALTEEVLRGINQLLGLTPLAIDALKEDLQNEDDLGLRQRAAALVTKYTIGHHALVQPKDAEPQAQMVVHFALPRPGVPVSADEVEPPQDLVECDECHVVKTSDQFVANSTRCQECYDKRRDDVLARFGSDVE